MQQEQLRAASAAVGEFDTPLGNINSLLQQQDDPQQVLNRMLMNIGGGVFPSHSSANDPPSYSLSTPPPPPPPRADAVMMRRVSSHSLDNDLNQQQSNNIFHTGNMIIASSVDSQQSGSLMSPPFHHQPPPPPPPPLPRLVRTSGGCSNSIGPTSPSPNSSRSSQSSSLGTVKAGPFLKGELAILKKEQAEAEALVALRTAGSSNEGLNGNHSCSPSAGSRLESGQRMNASAAMGKVQLGTFHGTGNTAVVEFSHHSLQPPPPPPPLPKPNQNLNDVLSPTGKPLQDGNKTTKIEPDFISTMISRPDEDRQQQLRPPSYSDWIRKEAPNPAEHAAWQ